VKFIRKGGRIIPIGVKEFVRSADGARVVKGTAVSVVGSRIKKQRAVHPNQALQAASFGVAVASGALSAATFFKGKAGLIGGTLGSLGLDVGSTALNIGAHARAGGTLKQKAKATARQEAFNTIAGNAVFVGGLLAQKQGREAAAKYATRGYEVAKTLLALARRKIVGV
jgi:hypothetical protein